MWRATRVRPRPKRGRITLAVAGFKPEDIAALQNVLVITGRRANKNRTKDGNFLHIGIATRAVERRFEFADFVREIPEAMKPRKVEIGGGASRPQSIENQQPADVSVAPKDERVGA